MSKRFTDTEKWSHAWFRKLKPKYKCAWSYLLDKCDYAGIWLEDFEAMSFNIGESIDQADFEKVFSGKVQKIDSDKYLIEAFIDFQYGTLNPNNKVHKSVIEKLGRNQAPTTPRGSPVQGAKEEEKEKEKETLKETSKEKEEEKESDESIPRDVLNFLTMSLFYPEFVIEEFRKEARLMFIGSTDPKKEWPRFVAAYFKNHKHRIEERVRELAKNLPKPEIAHADCKLCDNSGRAIMIEKASSCEFAFRCTCSRGAEHVGLTEQWKGMEEKYTHFKSWSVGNYDRTSVKKNHKVSVAI